MKEKPRTEPCDLSEQITLEEAKALQDDEEKEIMKDKIKDPRYPGDKWKKVQHTHDLLNKEKINIHYWKDKETGEKQDFKFKNEEHISKELENLGNKKKS